MWSNKTRVVSAVKKWYIYGDDQNKREALRRPEVQGEVSRRQPFCNPMTPAVLQNSFCAADCTCTKTWTFAEGAFQIWAVRVRSASGSRETPKSVFKPV